MKIKLLMWTGVIAILLVIGSYFPTHADINYSNPQQHNVAQFGGTAVVTGTGAGGSGIPRVTVSNDSSLAANQSVNVAQVGGTNSVNGGLAGTLAIGGTAGNNATINQNPDLIGVETLSTQPTAATTGNQRRLVGSLDGALYIRSGGPIKFSCGLNAIAASLTQCQAAPGANLSLYITDIVAQSNTTTAGLFTLRFGTGTNCGTGTGNLFFGSASALINNSASTAGPTVISFSTPIVVTANNAICVLGVVTNTTNIQINGFTAP